MNTVSGLQTALKLYASEKVKERSQGHEHIREIFGNRENLAIFQETASREGGAGWIALFQCLFQVVVVEKRAVMKKIGSAQGVFHFISVLLDDQREMVNSWLSSLSCPDSLHTPDTPCFRPCCTHYASAATRLGPTRASTPEVDVRPFSSVAVSQAPGCFKTHVLNDGTA